MNEINRALRKFVVKSGIPLKKLAEVIEMPAVKIMEWACGNESAISYKKIDLLATYLGVSTLEILESTFDESLVRKRIYAGPLSLPEKYATGAYSNVRTSAHIIDFLRFHFGQRKADSILSHLGVHPLIFDGLDNKININFFCDILNVLKSSGDPSLSVSKLANLSPLFLKETDFINSFSNCTHYADLYNIIMKNIDKFDKNFEYKYSISDKGLLFQAYPSEFLLKLLDEQNRQAVNFKDLFLYRKHLLGSYPVMINLEPLVVETRKAIFKGDACDEYQINFPVKDKKLTLVTSLTQLNERSL